MVIIPSVNNTCAPVENSGRCNACGDMLQRMWVASVRATQRRLISRFSLPWSVCSITSIEQYRVLSDSPDRGHSRRGHGKYNEHTSRPLAQEQTPLLLSKSSLFEQKNEIMEDMVKAVSIGTRF